MDEGSEIQKYLSTKTGQKTVPNIFIDQKHIGGMSIPSSLVSSLCLLDIISQEMTLFRLLRGTI